MPSFLLPLLDTFRLSVSLFKPACCALYFAFQLSYRQRLNVILICAGQSSGPTVSLGNWLRPQSTAVHSAAAADSTEVQLNQSSWRTHETPAAQTRQQSHCLPPQQHELRQQQLEHVHDKPGESLQQQSHKEEQQRLEGASVRNAAQRRRQQCLLEIERELLRHSSSDDEGAAGSMHLPGGPASKRQRTACTGKSSLAAC